VPLCSFADLLLSPARASSGDLDPGAHPRGEQDHTRAGLRWTENCIEHPRTRLKSGKRFSRGFSGNRYPPSTCAREFSSSVASDKPLVA
jgi:hypothetical protein